jgi:hypothetical protein
MKRITVRLALFGGLTALLPTLCAAQIYGWVDNFGNFTYSNLPPPKDVRVTDVIPEEPGPSPKAQAEAARLNELAALNERIRSLELQQMRRPTEVVDYAPPPPPVAAGCADGYDCGYEGVPAYTYGGAIVYPYAYRGGRYRAPYPYRGPVGPVRGARVATAHAGGGRAR